MSHENEEVKKTSSKRKVGVIGFGNLGKYLAKEIKGKGGETGLELAFVWNRTIREADFESLGEGTVILKDLNEFRAHDVDLIVEVAHPVVTLNFGPLFLQHADYMIGSPSALGDKGLEEKLRKASAASGRSLFVPSGALWGGSDIRKMSDRGVLEELNVKMHFHPHSLKLEEPLKSLNEQVADKPLLLYQGPVRNLCALAPNNVNTMACASIAGQSLGFDKVIGFLYSDPSLKDHHKIEIEVIGPSSSGNRFTVNTTRKSPAATGQVTSSATYASFFSSLLAAEHKGQGFHLC